MVLIQPTSCSTDNPLHMEIIDINEHPWHMHETMEVIYVLKGVLDGMISIYPSTLKAGDIAVINTETLHYFKANDDSVVLCCHIDLTYFSSLIPEIKNTLIICNSSAAIEYDKHYDILKNALESVFLYYFGLKTSDQNEMLDSCVNFLSVLYNHFNFLRHNGADIHSENIMKQRPLQAERVKRVMKYIYDNLSSKLSLEKMAEAEYVNKYYLSHLISEFLDMPFREYVNMTRAVYAQDYLYGTDLSLNEIVEQCGFSSPELFRKSYLKYVGVTPAADRRRVQGHTVKDMTLNDTNLLDHVNISEIASLMNIKSIYTALPNTLENKTYTINNVNIDFAHIEYKNSDITWDTFRIEDVRQILSSETKEALHILKTHMMFSKIIIDGDSLLLLYKFMGRWDFASSFLKTVAEYGFELIIQTDIVSQDLHKFAEFASICESKVTITAEVEEASFTADTISAVSIAASHFCGKRLYPSLYDTGSGQPYLFDKNNMKTELFYVYRFLNRLSANIVYQDSGCIVTASDERTSILLYNDLPNTRGISEIRKYMFNLKHLNRMYLYKQSTLEENYESETDIFDRLSMTTPVNDELKEMLQTMALPEMEVETIAASPEYNMFLSSLPNTLTLIELI